MIIVDHILDNIKKSRAEIEMAAHHPCKPKIHYTRNMAVKYSQALTIELDIIKMVSDLLSLPKVTYNKGIHLKLTMPEISWLNNSKPLVILFCLESSEPIYAYFRDES